MSRILIVAPYVPYPPNNGGKIRIFNLLRHLASKHEVTLLSYFSKPKEVSYASGLRDIGINVIFIQRPVKSRLHQGRKLFTTVPYQYYRYWTSEMQERIFNIVNQQKIDIIHIEHSYMGFFNLTFKRSVRTVLDMQNVESNILMQTFKQSRDPLRKGFSLWEWFRFAKTEKHIIKQFDYVIAVSEADKSWIKQHLRSGQKIVLAPNGVDLQLYQPRNQQSDPRIVFIGTMRYYPNVDAILYFVKYIFPLIKQHRPDLTLYIVGQDPTPEIKRLHDGDNIVVTGLVDDVRPYLNKALVAVVPLRIGSGTRLKILEAWASGVPVVSTSVGCSGLEFIPNEHLIVADDPSDFAEAVIKLAEDQKLRAKLVCAGRELVERKYSWEAIFTAIDDVYDFHAAEVHK